MRTKSEVQGMPPIENKKRLLYFTNNDIGRDVEMMLPLIYFAENILGCEVHTTLTPNLHEIYRKAPDCILIANTIGAALHFHIARAAWQAGIPVFALISEGNFPTDGSFDHWGYNTDRKLYQNYICCWSERTRAYLRGKEPDIADRIVLTGALGFDRYRFGKFLPRNEFLLSYGIQEGQFSRFIGYAGWGFGKLSHPRGRKEMLNYFKGDAEKLEWAEQQRGAVESILRQSIESAPETLFILKKHPTEHVAGEQNRSHNEMAALADYPNVLYIEECSLHDLINSVDLWWCYESTTSLEAEMMGKQSVFIVPDPNFPRTPLYKGFCEVQNFEGLSKASEHFFKYGSLPEYDESPLKDQREIIFSDTIGFGDGLNHIRAGFYLLETLNAERPKRTRAAPFYYFLVYWILRILVPLYHPKLFSRIPWLSRKLWVFEKYHLPGLNDLKQKRGIDLERFYTREGIKERFQSGTLFDNLIPH